ncbi:MAG: hypothetical protein AB7I04_10805 [Pseudomonadales bacterium]
MKKILTLVLILLCSAASLAMANPFQATDLSDVVINGQRLTRGQLDLMQMQLGAYIPPGIYLLDVSGCWLKVDSGEAGCLGGMSVDSRYGGGERTGDGSWNHWSNAADMGVGGTADGCIYTTSGWSNC